MGQVIDIDAYRYPWHEVFTADGPASTLQVYVNVRTGEVEVVQMNDDGEVIRTPIDSINAAIMSAALHFPKATAFV